MRIVLFCQQAYAFSILHPLKVAAEARGWDVLWYVNERVRDKFPYADRAVTSDIQVVEQYRPDAILVPGNEVPHYLRGVKVQVFHGFAGEKKGHFRIRDYFDLYLTQGPYFTERFRTLAEKHGNFEVVETGWPRVDRFFDGSVDVEVVREPYNLSAGPTLLYAPTFSPSLTSAGELFRTLEDMEAATDWNVLIKFHPLMDRTLVQRYRTRFGASRRMHVVEDDDVTPVMMAADALVSDTSSVVYEFLLLDKPVVTLRTTVANPAWTDIDDPEALIPTCKTLLAAGRLTNNPLREQYHPYTDGQSANRMLDAVVEYIDRHGVPEQRKLGFLRRRKIYRTFGKPL